jgi:S-adenosylmethionine:tRNA ribosyltransferase-isomerase
MFNIEDYNYDLRQELIAQVPAESRDHSRLLFVDRISASISDHHFFDLPGLLKPGDLLVVNDTRVIPARLFGRKESGGRVEILVLEHQDTDGPMTDVRWCLLKSSKRPIKGTRLFFERDVQGIVEALGEEGLTRIAFCGPLTIDAYINREDDILSGMDRERYQTIFSEKRGAVAAPTAGLHFTRRSIERLCEAGISLTALTLHVGHGTFKPVRTKDIRRHKLGEESYIIEQDTAEAVNRARRDGRRIIAVGTTVVRALESAAGPTGEVAYGRGKTDLLITPGFRFSVVDGVITNFHLPRSSLLFLVSAFGGYDLIKKAYRWAIEKRYRFYSYGDAMLIL